MQTVRSWNELLEEFKGHLAWSKTAELTEETERVITAINIVRLELDASIVKNANFLVNVVVLGMRTEFRWGSLLKNFILKKTGTIQKDNITTDFREMTCEDSNEGN